MSVWTGCFAGECLVSPLKRTLFLPECGEDLLEWASVLYFAGVTGITRQTGGGLPPFRFRCLSKKQFYVASAYRLGARGCKNL
jgi:hypothetical protein